MIMEDYVTFEQAKLLKELGFDECCYDRYNVDKKIEPNVIYNRTEVDSDMLCFDVNGRNIGDISAPTMSQAQKWLREVKQIIIIPCVTFIENIMKYEFYIVDEPIDFPPDNKIFDTYEQALSAGIDQALQLLTDKTEKI